MDRVLPAADADTTVRLLRGVERLPEGATGALVFGSGAEALGTLLVENKRVCWAAASGMETRLTDILSRQAKPPIPQELIEQAYERCRKEGIALGTALVSEGLVTPAGLQRALRQHTGEAVARLSRALSRTERISPSWHPSRVRRYEAQFTFTAAEILVCVGSLGREDDAARARRDFTWSVDDSTPAAAFPAGEAGKAGFPVAQTRGEELGVEGIVRLGRWAHEALAQASAIDPGRVLVTATTARHQSVAAWCHQDVLFAAMCEDRPSLSLLLARQIRTLAPIQVKREE